MKRSCREMGQVMIAVAGALVWVRLVSVGLAAGVSGDEPAGFSARSVLFGSSPWRHDHALLDARSNTGAMA
ncbi:MAG: hypothetical protein MK101_04445 [Phycisphaerales bacterium]|nr:hypothetical protein [Phycisphaerales bacterium]